jgi:hypothetical protein
MAPKVLALVPQRKASKFGSVGWTAVSLNHEAEHKFNSVQCNEIGARLTTKISGIPIKRNIFTWFHRKFGAAAVFGSQGKECCPDTSDFTVPVVDLIVDELHL